MSKCKDCRKVEAETTWWERKRYQLMYYLFAEDVANLIQEKYTQGIGDGYKLGYKACYNQQRDRESTLQEVLLSGTGFDITSYEEDKSARTV